jgi:hypothetical protein
LTNWLKIVTVCFVEITPMRSRGIWLHARRTIDFQRVASALCR